MKTSSSSVRTTERLRLESSTTAQGNVSFRTVVQESLILDGTRPDSTTLTVAVCDAVGNEEYQQYVASIAFPVHKIGAPGSVKGWYRLTPGPPRAVDGADAEQAPEVRIEILVRTRPDKQKTDDEIGAHSGSTGRDRSKFKEVDVKAAIKSAKRSGHLESAQSRVGRTASGRG